MNKSKLISLVMAAAMLSSSLVGCGSSSNSADTSVAPSLSSESTASVATESKSSGEAVELNVVHYLTEKPKIEALNSLVEGFQKENTNVKVNVESMSLDQYADVLKMKLATGDAPNILFGSPKTFSDIVKAGNILDLTEQEFVKRIDSKFIANVKINEKVYGIPLDLLPSGMFYNKDIFQKAGVTVPRTWDEFIQVCEKLKSQGITPIAAGYKDDATLGGSVYTELYGSPYSKMPDFQLELMEGKIKATELTPLKEFMGRWRTRNKYLNEDALQIGIDRSEQMFASGKTAMICLGSWGIAAVRQYNPDGNFGAFMFPSENNADDNLMATATDDTWMIAKNAPNTEVALKFFDYMTMPESAKVWASKVQVLSAINGVSADKLDPIAQDLKDIYDTGKVYNWLQKDIFSGQFDKIWVSSMREYVYTEDMTADQFLKKLDSEFDGARK